MDLEELGRVARRHPLALDAAGLAVLWLAATVLITTPGELDHSHGRWLGAAVNVVLVLPLALRRRAPLRVLTAVAALASVSALGFGLSGGELALVPALAAVVALDDGRPVRRGLAVVVTTVLAVVLALALHPDPVSPSLWLVGAAVVVAVSVGTAQRSARQLVRARAARQVQEREQAAALAVVAERTRIAREVHDVVAHSVSLMVRMADGAARTVDASPPRAKEVMVAVAGTGRETLTELRGLLGVLGPPAPPGSAPDLAPAPDLDQLPALVARTREAGLPVSLDVEGDPVPVRSAVGLAVHRLVQEALTNVLRHARSPGQVRVRLRYEPGALAVAVDDDGAAVAAPVTEGRGLAGMRERMASVGAVLEAGPTPEGWAVRAVIPLSGEQPT